MKAGPPATATTPPGPRGRWARLPGRWPPPASPCRLGGHLGGGRAGWRGDRGPGRKPGSPEPLPAGGGTPAPALPPLSPTKETQLPPVGVPEPFQRAGSCITRKWRVSKIKSGPLRAFIHPSSSRVRLLLTRGEGCCHLYLPWGAGRGICKQLGAHLTPRSWASNGGPQCTVKKWEGR